MAQIFLIVFTLIHVHVFTSVILPLRNCPWLQNTPLTSVYRPPRSPDGCLTPHTVKTSQNIKLDMSEYLPSNVTAETWLGVHSSRPGNLGQEICPLSPSTMCRKSRASDAKKEGRLGMNARSSHNNKSKSLWQYQPNTLNSLHLLSNSTDPVESLFFFYWVLRTSIFKNSPSVTWDQKLKIETQIISSKKISKKPCGT